MSEEFKTSKGLTVTLEPDGALGVRGPGGLKGWITAFHCDDVEEAFAEYFRHIVDLNLDRVRWPEDPSIVLYPTEPGAVRVLNEETGGSFDMTYPLIPSPGMDLTHKIQRAARWWFDSRGSFAVQAKDSDGHWRTMRVYRAASGGRALARNMVTDLQNLGIPAWTIRED